MDISVMSNKRLFEVSVGDLLNGFNFMLDQKLSGIQAPKVEQCENMTRKEVASYLKITLPTLHDWSKNGTLKPYKINSRVYYRRNEVETLFQHIGSIKHRKLSPYGFQV